MLSGRGLCDERITRPEESYRLWCVVMCDLETSRMGAPYIYDISRLRGNPFSDITRFSSTVRTKRASKSKKYLITQTIKTICETKESRILKTNMISNLSSKGVVKQVARGASGVRWGAINRHYSASHYDR